MCVIREFLEQYTLSHTVHRYSSWRSACLSAICLFREAFEHSTFPHSVHENNFLPGNRSEKQKTNVGLVPGRVQNKIIILTFWGVFHILIGNPFIQSVDIIDKRCFWKSSGFFLKNNTKWKNKKNVKIIKLKWNNNNNLKKKRKMMAKLRRPMTGC